MSKLFIPLLLIFIGIFLFRLNQIGGFDRKYQDPQLQELSSLFSPARNNLAQKSQQLLPSPQAALLSGILLGVQSSLPPAFKKALANTSTTHIVVVSGQNLTLVGGFFLGFATLLGRKKTILLSLIAITLYALLTGLQAPVVRAALMVGLASIAKLLNREGDSIWILALTCATMLIYNPNWLISISFQLSALSTLAVISIAPALIKKATLLPEIIKQDLLVSASAQIITLPIIAINFHQISLVGILVNSLILWVVPIVMITGSIVLITSLINLSLAFWLALIPGVLLTYFVDIIYFFNQSWSSLKVGDLSPLVWIGYYLIIFSLIFSLKKSK